MREESKRGGPQLSSSMFALKDTFCSEQFIFEGFGCTEKIKNLFVSLNACRMAHPNVFLGLHCAKKETGSRTRSPVATS